MSSPQRLPAAFTSLYRLFLRTCSATTLHHQTGTRYLRLLWRPTFEVAAKVINDLTKEPEQPSHQTKRQWLQVWEKRIDNTLAFLYTSSQFRGLCHQITRNAGLMISKEYTHYQQVHSPRVWSPHLSPESYNPASKRRKDKEPVPWITLAPLTEVIRLAEGRDGISLGRAVLKPRAPVPRRRSWIRILKARKHRKFSLSRPPQVGS